jgi:hypothetical protein
MAETTLVPDDGTLADPPARDGDVLGIADRLGAAYREMAAFYRDELGLTPDEAHRRASEPDDATALLARLLGEQPGLVSWIGLQELTAQDAAAAVEVWRHLKTTAHEQFATGVYAGEPLEEYQQPWDRARFIALVETFRDEWQPQGGIERALVDMLAQQYTAWQFWLGMLHVRSTIEAQFDEIERSRSRHWQPPRLDAAQAIDQAAMMADRFNRLFLRTLRGLRDYRRYAVPPVVVQHAGQVNVGQQQVNVAASQER